MLAENSQTPRVAQLADCLADDISNRNLKAGDRYLTTSEASKKFGVSNGIANKFKVSGFSLDNTAQTYNRIDIW